MSDELLNRSDDPVVNNAYDALKNTADKVMQGLEKVRDHKEINCRRWIWELVQNAKDVRNRFGQVSVKITRYPDRLVFAHNGDPFHTWNVTALINQVSAKPSDSVDLEITGKYGTGFISTHLLNTRITVKGVVQRQGRPAKRMTLLLDRAGTRSEDLIPKIKAAQRLVEHIDEDASFSDIEDYEGRRSEAHFDTEFIYPLEDEEAQDTVRFGLADLTNTLPHTLGNLGKIKRLVVDDQVEGQLLEYHCEVVEDNGAVRKLKMTGGQGEPVYFISYRSGDITLTVEVDGLGAPKLKPNFGDQPTLYRDFPLIGTERFHFPFILNSSSFYPKEERNGIFLNDEKSAQVSKNRDVLARAMNTAIEFGTWLVENGAKDLYVIAYSRLPEDDLKEGAKQWYRDQQRAWRAKLLELPLVECANGTTTRLKEAVIPKHGNARDAQEAFWELHAALVGYGKVPRKDLLHHWLRAIGPMDESSSWDQGVDLIQGLEDLFKLVHEKGSLSNLVLDDIAGGPSPSALRWLERLFRFAYEQKEGELLDKYAVVPDQHGDFHRLNELYLEDPVARIPDAILDVLKKLGVDWRTELIHRGLDLGATSHKRWGLADASKRMAELLGDGRIENGIAKSFLARTDALDVLFELLSIVPPNGRQGFRVELFQNAKRLWQRQDALRETPDCAEFNFEPAIRLLLERMHGLLTELESLEALARAMVASIDQATIWLDKHLRLLDTSSLHRPYLDKGNIVPNRYGYFIGYADLYNYGSEDTPLDAGLINILHELDPSQDWNAELIGDGIGIAAQKSRIMLQLGKAIDEQVSKIWGQAAVTPALLQSRQVTLVLLIDWCNDHDGDAIKYLPSFMQIKDKLSFDLIIKPNLANGVIGLLGDKRYGEVLNTIHRKGLNADKVNELLEITGALGTLDTVISKAKEMLEEKQDFEYKKELGERMEQLLKEALDSEGFNTSVQGIGDYDISVTNPANGKSFYIELKSTAQGSTDALKLAPSQAREWKTDVMNRALCLIERSKTKEPVTVAYVKEHLLTRTGLAHDLAMGNVAYAKFEEVQEGEELDIQLLGAVRVKLGRTAYLEGAGNYEQLIHAIRHALA